MMVVTVSPGIVAAGDPVVAVPPRRLSWGAVLAGVMLAVAIQLLPGILGPGVGLSMVDPVEETTLGATGFGIGASTSFLLVLALLAGAGAAAFGATTATRRRPR